MIIIVLSWSKVFSVMLYSNCKLHDFKRKKGCEIARVGEKGKERKRARVSESERKKERGWQREGRERGRRQ